MKSKLRVFLLSLICGSTLMFVASSAQAAYCRWVGAHWWNGVYYPAHKVCYQGGYYRCKWVGGFWRHGYWHPARRVCW